MRDSGSSPAAPRGPRSERARALGRGALAYAAWLGASLLVALRAEQVVREYAESAAPIPTLDHLALVLTAHWPGLVCTGTLLCLGIATWPFARRTLQLGRWSAATGAFVGIGVVAVAILEPLAERAELAAAMSSLAGRATSTSAAPLALRAIGGWAPVLYAGLLSGLLGADERPGRRG